MLYRSIVLLLAFAAACAQETTTTGQPEANNATIVFGAADLLQMPEDTVIAVVWNTTVPGVQHFRIDIEDKSVGDVEEGATINLYEEGSEYTAGGQFEVKAILVGFNTITLVLLDGNDEELASESLDMSVVLAYQRINNIFTTSTSVLLAISYVNMGATIDLNLIKQIAKKPIGPLLGIFCQYIGMPVLALGLSFLVYSDDPLMRLGMFMAGCVPGGGPSNMWTHLLGGSLDLSVMMTFTSTVAAFGFIPAWVLGVGPLILGDEADFAMPFEDIAIIIVSLVIPCAVGLLIQRFLPRVQKILQFTLTPFSLFYILYIFSFGLYANRFVFDFFTARMVLSSLALPWLGYTLGLVLSTLCKQSRRDRIAISIETGIQNVALALVMLNLTLEAPTSTLSTIIPVTTVIATPFPLLTVYAIKVIYTKFFKKPKQEKEKEKEADTATPGSDIEKGPSNSVSKSGTEMTATGDKSRPSGGGVDNPAADLSDTP